MTKPCTTITRRAFTGGALAFGALSAGSAHAQDFGGLLGRATDLLGNLGVDDWLEGEAPISTQLSDAQWGNAALDGDLPPVAPARLANLERTERGGFLLQPGYWQMSTQSYCLHAGTHGPGGGDGYLYAPIRGSQEEAVRDILRNSVSRSDISQRDIQVLIWAILARTRFEDMRSRLQAVAASLLSTEQLGRLNRSAMDLVPRRSMGRVLGELPSPLRSVFQAEANLRRRLTQGRSTYAQLEEIAVLTGDAPMGRGSQAIARGRWNDHPDGYRIRYIPSGYSRTQTEIWVEEGSAGIGAEYDPSVHVAVPGNTSRQRLAQSGREHS